MSLTPLVAIALLGQSSYTRRPALTRPAVTVYVSGEQVRFDRVAPVTVGRRILVPLRGIFEKLGATVHYDPATRLVTAKRKNKVITLQVDRRTARINGAGHLMDTYPRIRQGHVLVPIRFVAETLDCGVVYSRPQNFVKITPH